MHPTVEQIAGDRYYFETCKEVGRRPIWTVFFVRHDLSTTEKARDRWYRVWQKTEEGFCFLRMQQGRFSHWES